MPRNCTICRRPDRALVEAAIRADGVRPAARKLELSVGCVQRHAGKCMLAAEVAAEVQASPPRPTEMRLVVDDERPANWNAKGPGRNCTICTRADRAEIDAALLEHGVTRTDVAKRFQGAAEQSIWRHARHCIPHLIRRASVASEGAIALRIVEDLAKLRAVAFALLAKAESFVDTCERSIKAIDEHGNMLLPTSEDKAGFALALKSAVAVAGEARSVVELIGRVTGEVRTRDTSVREGREWPAIVTAIGEAVADCESCSRALEDVLGKMEAA